MARPWPWLAVGLAVLVPFPHLSWLAANDFPTLRYVENRGGESGSLFSALEWLATQALDHAPLAVFFLFLGYRSVWDLPRDAAASSDIRFIAFFALGPAVLTAALSALTGIGLRDMWGMPMFTLSGPLIVFVLGRQWSLDLSARAVQAAAGFVIVLAIAYSSVVALSPFFGSPQRNAWPMREFAEAAQSAWSSRSDEALRIVAGPRWLAGLVAAGSPDRPSVLYDGRLALSPWLSERQLEEEGVLYVWEGKEAPPGLVPEDSQLDFGSFAIAGTPIPDGTIGYAIQLPKR